MNAVKIYLFFILTIVCMRLSAQALNGYYFNDFTLGRVLLKNKQFANGKFNYDLVNHQMHYLDGNTDMIVENLSDIEVIVIDTVRFMPFTDRFLEVLQGEQATLLLDREIKVREYGKVGAMGVATHGSVQAIDVNARFQRVNGDNKMDLTIYKDDIAYIYFVQIKRTWKSFRNQVTFLKLFPKKEQEKLRAIIKEMKTDFNEPQEVLKFWDECQLRNADK